MMMNNFHYPAEYKDTLSSYFLLHWQGSYFAGQFKEGVIEYQGVKYTVILNDCTLYTAKRAHQLRLSFRAAQDIYQLNPIVIVSPLVERM
jgi:hypothetical protein